VSRIEDRGGVVAGALAFLGSPGESVPGPLIRYFIGHNPPFTGGRSFVPGMKVVYAWMEGEEGEGKRERERER